MLRSRHEAFSTASTKPNTLQASTVYQLDGSSKILSMALAAREFLEGLLDQQLLNVSAVEQYLEQLAEEYAEFATAEALGTTLVEAKLLTQYQLDRVAAG